MGMGQKSRTKNALRNSAVSMMCHLINVLASFGCRTVFSLTLGKEYLGVGGLFTNILTILSFAELGIGTAVVFRLYKPLTENDQVKIQQYMLLYKKIYHYIALIVTVAGLLVVPFLKYIVVAPNIVEDIRLIYILYLLHTSISYLFSYKKAVITADQKDYIVSLITQTVSIVMNIAQCIVLVITKNFVLYLVMQIVFSLISNLFCSVYADRKYPAITKKSVIPLSKEEKQGLWRDVKGLMLTKIAATTFNGTDNIFISKFIGISYVGILSNYTLLIATINTVMNKVFGSITASIGNLALLEDKKDVERVLERIYFINASLYCFICTGILVLMREFVTTIWFDKSYELSTSIVILATLELMLRSLHFPIHTTQMAIGLFSQYRIMYLVASVLNIILDFLLIKPLGIAGLFIATIFCRGIIFVTDIMVVYKIGFRKSPIRYFKMVASWLGFVCLTSVSSAVVTSFFRTGVLFFAIKVLMITFIYWGEYVLIFRKSQNFKYMKGLIGKIIKRRL